MKSIFKSVFDNTQSTQDLHRFLQVVFHLYPENKFHQLLQTLTAQNASDEAIYQEAQQKLSSIKPFLSEFTYALPALRKQKKEMAKQVMQLLGDKTHIHSYLEIGSTGRYWSELKKQIRFQGTCYLTNDIAPSFQIGDMFERGQIFKTGKFFPLQDYKAISSETIPNESIDLINFQIGLHHCPQASLSNYVQSLRNALRPGGLLILREHDVRTPEMHDFVSLVHTVFNLGLMVNWQTNEAEYKSFRSADEWSAMICAHGFRDRGVRLLQDNDPSLNTLMAFEKIEA